MTRTPAASDSVRPARDDDYARLAEIYGLHDPDEIYSGAELRRSDAAFAPPHRHHRLVADEGAGVLGTAAAMHMPGAYHPRRFFVEVVVHPAARGRGLGRALYAAVLDEVADARPERLRIRAREGDARSRTLLERLGYRETKRDWTSAFDLARLEPATTAAAERRVEKLGLRIASFAQIREERGREEAERLAYEVFSEVRRDVPRAEPATQLSMDDYRRHVLEEPGFLADGLHLALDGERGVGMTQLFASEASDDLFVGLTGVVRTWRGRGLATALKRHSLARAAARGAVRVTTQNDSTNEAMLAINERLGFERGEAWLSLALELPGDRFEEHRRAARRAAGRPAPDPVATGARGGAEEAP